MRRIAIRIAIRIAVCIAIGVALDRRERGASPS
jgi:hypothetical protein